MKAHNLKERLLQHAIDRPGEPLPPELMQALEQNPDAEAEWKRLQGWVGLLKTEETWEAPEGFYEKLADRAEYEKRRADLTANTLRDLNLGDEDRVWRPYIGPWFARGVLAALFLLVIGMPLFMMVMNEWNQVGRIDFVEGNLLVQGSDNPQSGTPIQRGTSISTPQNAQSVITLEGGAQLALAPLSRVTVENARTIHVNRGRVYCDITPGQGDFEVLVPDGRVQVLGTEFEVFVTDEQSQVTVTQGTVAVSNNKQSQTLGVGDQSRMTLADTLSVQQVNSLSQRMTWVQTLYDKKDKSDMRSYYPSLARPTQTAGD